MIDFKPKINGMFYGLVRSLIYEALSAGVGVSEVWALAQAAMEDALHTYRGDIEKMSAGH